MKRRSLVHLREAFLPLMGLFACILGRAEAAAALLGAFLLVRTCCLCADGAYLRAAADELSVQGLTRLRRTAGLMLVIGMLLSGALVQRLVPEMRVMPLAHAACYWGAAVWMMTCRFSAAYMTADGEEESAALSELLMAILLTAGVFLGGAGFRFGEKVAADAMLSDARWDAPALCLCAAALISILTALAAHRIAPAAKKSGLRLSGKMFARAPMAMLRELICPALMGAFVYFAGVEILPAALAGWALAAAGRSLYRRSAYETPPLMAAFVPVSAVIVLAAAVLPQFVPLAAVRSLSDAEISGWPCAGLAVAVSAAVTVLMNAHISLKSILCAVLLLAAGALSGMGIIWAAAASAAAALSAIPYIREAALGLRAARTRRKYQRK